MIWVAGKIVENHELAIPCTDRVFQHGLGLFETFATWGGQVRLLSRHRERMLRSAEALGLKIDPGSWPDHAAVDQLWRALKQIDPDSWPDRVTAEAEILRLQREGIEVVFRVVLTGGSEDRPGIVWMSVRDVGRPNGCGHKTFVARASATLSEPSPLAGHKTLNYWTNRIVSEAAASQGFAEEIWRDSRGRLLEGTRSNLFLIRGDRIQTPAADGRLLPGIMRGLVLELAPEAGLVVEEVEGGLTDEAVRQAETAFLTNSGRGMTRLNAIDLGRSERVEYPRRRREIVYSRLYDSVRDWLWRREVRGGEAR